MLRFDTSNYELDRSLPKGKNEKVMGLLKDDLRRKIRSKDGGYLIDDGSKDKKAKRHKNSVTKRKLKLKKQKNCLDATKLE